MRHDISPNRILIVDDERNITDFLKSAARGLGFVARTAHTFDAFAEIEPEFDPTVVLLDLEMPGNVSKDYLKLLAQQESDARIVLTGGLDKRATSRATLIGSVLGLDMVGTLQKPLAIHALRQELRKLLHESRPLTAGQLGAAIKAGEIRPHFQPKVSRDQRGDWIISEAEALARWYRPDGSIVMPNHFIGLAEDSGLMTALTDSLLQQVVLQLNRWARQGIELRVAINISPTLLSDCTLPDETARTLEISSWDFCMRLMRPVSAA